jgi:hypothetical protein
VLVEEVGGGPREWRRSGRRWPGLRARLGAGLRPLWGPLIIDLEATLIEAHSNKQGAAGTYKQDFGFHPLVAEAMS